LKRKTDTHYWCSTDIEGSFKSSNLKKTSLEELKKQEYLKNQRDQHVHDGKLIKQIANMENNEAIKEKEHKNTTTIKTNW